MEFLLLIKAAIMGIVEGLTEFLPVSSTGHLIIAGQLLDFLDKEKRGVFEIFIQLGAILAVCWEYRAKIGQVVGGLGHKAEARSFTLNLMIAFFPAALLGLLFASSIKAHLFNPTTVAIAFILGGLIILWAERRQHQVHVQEVDDMNWRDALKVGLIQCLALIPGTSRSGATIIGALFFGFSRKAATEFSFFLAIPTIAGATAYDLYKHRDVLNLSDLPVFATGFIVAFISAFIAIRALLKFISRHDFVVFAWYRIAFGLVILATASMVDWTL